MKTSDPDFPAGVRFLDDLRIGERFTSDTYAMDADKIKEFARQFDPQPFHLDEVAAGNSFFGGLAASGWHTAAVTMRLLVTSTLHLAGGSIGAGVELAWPNPTRPDDLLHVESEILDLRPSKSRLDRGVATLRSETINQHGSVVQRMTSKMIVLRRPETAGE